MTRFVFDNSPLLKILLHGAKFSSSSINGLLIGRGSEDNVRVVDAIPLFHTILTLSPQLEIALALVEQRLKGTDDGIVGLYVADAHMSRDDFDAASKTIANKVATLTTAPSTLALIVENGGLHDMMQLEDVLPFKLYTRVSGPNSDHWTVTDYESQGANSIQPLFVDMLNRELYKKLHDFDEHLDDIQKDFWNAALRRTGRVCAMHSELLALSSYLSYSPPECLFLLSLTLTLVNFVLLCSARARKQSLQLLVATGNLLLVAVLALVVLGLPFGFLYLAFQGLVWLTSSLANTFPALRSLQNVIARAFF